MFFAASALTSAAISVDRLLALLLGLRYRHVVTLCRVRVLIACVWFIAVSNASLLCVARILFHDKLELASWWTLQVFGIFSITVATFSYTKIFFTLRHQQAQVRDHVQPEQSSRVRSVLNIARYKKTVYSVAWIQFAMLACYGPYTILGSVSSLRGYSFEINIANEFCFCLLYLNSCLNPVLYCWKIRDVKQEVKKTICKFLCFWFYLLCWREVQLASYNGIQDILAWALDFSSWIPDSTHWIPVFVSGTWILDSNRKWDSGFLELYSGFQRPGFSIPQEEFRKFWIPYAKISWV